MPIIGARRALMQCGAHDDAALRFASCRCAIPSPPKRFGCFFAPGEGVRAVWQYCRKTLARLHQTSATAIGTDWQRGRSLALQEARPVAQRLAVEARHLLVAIED